VPDGGTVLVFHLGFSPPPPSRVLGCTPLLCLKC
jgi:hypothetical protein